MILFLLAIAACQPIIIKSRGKDNSIRIENNDKNRGLISPYRRSSARRYAGRRVIRRSRSYNNSGWFSSLSTEWQIAITTLVFVVTIVTMVLICIYCPGGGYCASPLFFYRKLNRISSTGRKLTLNSLKAEIKKHGRKRLYEILRTEARSMGGEEPSRADFNIEFKRIRKLVKKKMPVIRKHSKDRAYLRKLAAKEGRKYFLKYHNFDIVDHIPEVKRALYKVNDRLPKYIKYLAYGKYRG